MENSRNKRIISLKLCTILRRVMKSHGILTRTWLIPLSRSPHYKHSPAVSHFTALLVLRYACGQVTLILLNSPNAKSGDAGNLAMPKKSWEVLPLSERVKVLDLKRKEKNLMLRLLRSRVTRNLLFVEIVKNEKNFC